MNIICEPQEQRWCTISRTSQANCAHIVRVVVDTAEALRMICIMTKGHSILHSYTAPPPTYFPATVGTDHCQMDCCWSSCRYPCSTPRAAHRFFEHNLYQSSMLLQFNVQSRFKPMCERMVLMFVHEIVSPAICVFICSHHMHLTIHVFAHALLFASAWMGANVNIVVHNLPGSRKKHWQNFTNHVTSAVSWLRHNLAHTLSSWCRVKYFELTIRQLNKVLIETAFSFR